MYESEKDRKVCELYEEIRNIKHVALELHIHRNTVTNILDKYGVKRTGRSPEFTQEEKMKAEDMLRQGISMTTIAKTVKHSHKVLREYFESVGIDDLIKIQYNNRSIIKAWTNEDDDMRIATEVIRKIKPAAEYDVHGNIQGYRVEQFMGIESPNICTIPKWKIKLEKKGVVNYGYGYFPKAVL